jgi:hypothetical protein
MHKSEDLRDPRRCRLCKKKLKKDERLGIGDCWSCLNACEQQAIKRLQENTSIPEQHNHIILDINQRFALVWLMTKHRDELPASLIRLLEVLR